MKLEAACIDEKVLRGDEMGCRCVEERVEEDWRRSCCLWCHALPERWWRV